MPGVRSRPGFQQHDIDFTLRKVFGKDSFRPLQREVINATLEKHDVYLQAATSFGKSICFQLPAIVDHGITIVVSPLIALMANQISIMRDAGVRVATINHNIPKSERELILDDLRCGHPMTRLLYVTPELCSMDYFRRALATVHSQGELARIAIDEAHCISEWGHDFRPSFSALSYFKQHYPTAPILCCTATATATVREDIIRTLGLDPSRLKIFTMSTSRPNLHYEVRFKSEELGIEEQYASFVHWLQAIYARRKTNPLRAAHLASVSERPTNVSGIIYTHRRRDTEALAQRLTQDGIAARPYHAGLTPAEKDDHLAGWASNRPGYDVMVATTAFGMGIDKTDVRFVVHWGLPKSFEGFYQEAGRAGRDGRAAVCVLYYGREDRDNGLSMMARERERSFAGREEGKGKEGVAGALKLRAESFGNLVEYCEQVGKCRHKMIADYFGDEDGAVCDWACDYCKDAKALVKRKEEGLATEEWCSTQRQTGRYEYDEYD